MPELKYENGDLQEAKEVYGYIDVYNLGVEGNIEMTIPIKEKKVTIGRDHNCQIRVHNVRVSRRHCCILIEDNNGQHQASLISITDKAKTFVNGITLSKDQKLILKSSQEFQISNHELRWREAEPLNAQINVIVPSKKGQDELISSEVEANYQKVDSTEASEQPQQVILPSKRGRSLKKLHTQADKINDIVYNSKSMGVNDAAVEQAPSPKTERFQREQNVDAGDGEEDIPDTESMPHELPISNELQRSQAEPLETQIDVIVPAKKRQDEAISTEVDGNTEVDSTENEYNKTEADEQPEQVIVSSKRGHGRKKLPTRADEVNNILSNSKAIGGKGETAEPASSSSQRKRKADAGDGEEDIPVSIEIPDTESTRTPHELPISNEVQRSQAEPLKTQIDIIVPSKKGRGRKKQNELIPTEVEVKTEVSSKRGRGRKNQDDLIKDQKVDSTEADEQPEQVIVPSKRGRGLKKLPTRADEVNDILSNSKVIEVKGETAEPAPSSKHGRSQRNRKADAGDGEEDIPVSIEIPDTESTAHELQRSQAEPLETQIDVIVPAKKRQDEVISTEVDGSTEVDSTEADEQPEQVIVPSKRGHWRKKLPTRANEVNDILSNSKAIGDKGETAEPAPSSSQRKRKADAGNGDEDIPVIIEIPDTESTPHELPISNEIEVQRSQAEPLKTQIDIIMPSKKGRGRKKQNELIPTEVEVKTEVSAKRGRGRKNQDDLIKDQNVDSTEADEPEQVIVPSKRGRGLKKLPTRADEVNDILSNSKAIGVKGETAEPPPSSKQGRSQRNRKADAGDGEEDIPVSIEIPELPISNEVQRSQAEPLKTQIDIIVPSKKGRGRKKQNELIPTEVEVKTEVSSKRGRGRKNQDDLIKDQKVDSTEADEQPEQVIVPSKRGRGLKKLPTIADEVNNILSNSKAIGGKGETAEPASSLKQGRSQRKRKADADEKDIQANIEIRDTQNAAVSTVVAPRRGRPQRIKIVEISDSEDDEVKENNVKPVVSSKRGHAKNKKTEDVYKIKGKELRVSLTRMDEPHPHVPNCDDLETESQMKVLLKEINKKQLRVSLTEIDQQQMEMNQNARITRGRQLKQENIVGESINVKKAVEEPTKKRRAANKVTTSVAKSLIEDDDLSVVEDMKVKNKRSNVKVVKAPLKQERSQAKVKANDDDVVTERKGNNKGDEGKEKITLPKQVRGLKRKNANVNEDEVSISSRTTRRTRANP